MDSEKTGQTLIVGATRAAGTNCTTTSAIETTRPDDRSNRCKGVVSWGDCGYWVEGIMLISVVEGVNPMVEERNQLLEELKLQLGKARTERKIQHIKLKER